jgi:transcriptional regulator with XRE-family HTH domain
MPGRIAHGKRRRPTYIREWRKFRKLTQETVAEYLETTKTSVSRVENGKQPYTQDFLEGAADLLAVHPSVLLSRAPGKDDKTH